MVAIKSEAHHIFMIKYILYHVVDSPTAKTVSLCPHNLSVMPSAWWKLIGVDAGTIEHGNLIVPILRYQNGSLAQRFYDIWLSSQDSSCI